MNKNPDILFRNFDVFQTSEKEAKNLKSLVFQLAISGRLDFQKLSKGRIKKSLQALVKEQQQHLKKEGIAFAEKSSNVWPLVKLGDIATVNSGNSAPQDKKFFNNGRYPFCRTSDVGKVHISDDFREIHDLLNDEGIKGLKLFKKDTILIPKSGASTFLNHRVFLGIDSYVSSHLATIYTNQKIILPKLLFNLLCFIDTRELTSEQNYPSLKLSQIKEIHIPLPPLEVQKEIVSLMEKCALMETQAKEKSKKQKEFSKSVTYFITHSKNKKELSHYWKMLKSNFKDILYSENGSKEFKSMIFQLCLNGGLDFQKLSEERIKKPLQDLVKEQKQHLKREGIAFAEKSSNVWPLVKLGDICKLYQPKTISKKEMIKTGKYLVFGANGVIGKYNKYNHAESEILITCRGATCGTVNLSEPKSWITGNAMVVKILSFKTNKKYLFHLLQNSNFESVITGAAQPQITRQKLAPLPIPLPPMMVQKEITALMKHIENMEKQIQKEKNLSIQLSQSLSHLDRHQKII